MNLNTCIFGPEIGHLLELQATAQHLARTTGTPAEMDAARKELGGTPRPATPMTGTPGFHGIGLDDLATDL